MARGRDVEADLNLPPGFRFHPTDEELVVHYLCRKISGQSLPVTIIAEVDLYKFDPWDLPEMALFGNREWYFYTPRDRKYPNGSRPNRAAGRGYWKATGADKPVSPMGSARPLGIKKALVFYQGKAPRGIKTDWIMHEYRLADTDHRPVHKNGSQRLDDWVLCRLYHKKNSWEKKKQVAEAAEDTRSDSLWTQESDTEHVEYGDRIKPAGIKLSTLMVNAEAVGVASVSNPQMVEGAMKEEETDWFMDLNLEGLQGTLGAIGSTSAVDIPSHDYYYNAAMGPFWS